LGREAARTWSRQTPSWARAAERPPVADPIGSSFQETEAPVALRFDIGCKPTCVDNTNPSRLDGDQILASKASQHLANRLSIRAKVFRQLLVTISIDDTI